MVIQRKVVYYGWVFLTVSLVFFEPLGKKKNLKKGRVKMLSRIIQLSAE